MNSSAGSQVSHTVGLTQPNLNSPRVWDSSVTLTWFSKLAKASTQGMAAVACGSYGEPQVRAECQGWGVQWRTSCPKKDMASTLTKVTDHSLNTPYTPRNGTYYINNQYKTCHMLPLHLPSEITSRSTLTCIGSTCCCAIYGANRTIHSFTKDYYNY